MVALVALCSKHSYHLRVVQRAASSGAQAHPGFTDDSTLRRYRIHQRLGPDGVTAVLAAYEAGEPAKSIAQQFGVSRQSVNVLAEEAGLPRRLKRLTTEQEDQIIQLYESGLGQGRVAKQLGLGKSTVQAVLRRNDIATSHSTLPT